MFRFTVTLNRRYENTFHDGWFAMHLGREREAPPGLTPLEEESWLLGWDTANETSLVGRYVALAKKVDINEADDQATTV